MVYSIILPFLGGPADRYSGSGGQSGVGDDAGSTHCALVAGADERGRILLDLCGDETGRALNLFYRTPEIWLRVKTVLAEFKGGAEWD